MSLTKKCPLEFNPFAQELFPERCSFFDELLLQFEELLGSFTLKGQMIAEPSVKALPPPSLKAQKGTMMGPWSPPILGRAGKDTTCSQGEGHE